jgi:hypothetical protein
MSLFSTIAAISGQGKDVLTLFHSLSTLSGHFRPYFTLDILRSLIMSFQPMNDNPSAFFHFSGTNTGLRLPSISNVQPFNRFLFFVDLVLLDASKGILFGISTAASSFSFCFVKQLLTSSCQQAAASPMGISTTSF